MIALSRFRGVENVNLFRPDADQHFPLKNAETWQNIQYANPETQGPKANPKSFQFGLRQPSKAPNQHGTSLHHLQRVHDDNQVLENPIYFQIFRRNVDKKLLKNIHIRHFQDKHGRMQSIRRLVSASNQ